MKMKRLSICAAALMLALAMTITAMPGCAGGTGSETDDVTGTVGTQPPASSETQSQTQSETAETKGEDEMMEELSPKVKITDGTFTVGGREFFVNGVNTPWENWNDFGGSFNASFWNGHFRDLRSIGVNATRVWINCNSRVGIKLAEDGTVAEVTDKHWSDVDALFTLAERNRIYLLPTLLSFDHFKSPDSADRWRLVVTDETARRSFIENYVVPFAERYGDSPYLFGIDLMNEPDWVHENEECGQLSLDDMSRFFAECTAAIHEASPDTLVTVGVGIIKYNSEKYEGNIISDAVMKKYGGEDACVDFYSTHYYEWMKPWFGVPYSTSPKGFGLDGGKPCILGEIAADSSEDLKGIYEKAYENGWCGIMEWASNNVSAHADNWDDIKAATENIANIIPERVFPLEK